MDITKLDIGKFAEEGAPMELRHPSTGDVVKDDKGPVILWLKGKDSKSFRSRDRELARTRLTKARKLNATELADMATDYEAQEKIEAKLLAAVTVGWSDNMAIGDEKLEFSEAAAEKLYLEYPWIADQVRNFIKNRENFLKS